MSLTVLPSLIPQGAYNVMYVPGEGKMAHGEKKSEIKLGEKGAVCTEGKGPNWHCEFKVFTRLIFVLIILINLFLITDPVRASAT